LGIVAAAIVAAAFPSSAPAAGSEPATTATTPAVTTPAVTTPATTTPATAPSKPPPAHGKVTIYLPDAFFVHRQAVTVPKRVFHVVGIVRPYVPDQRVTVRAFLGRRWIESKKLRLTPSQNRTYGHFRLGGASPGAGTIALSVTR